MLLYYGIYLNLLQNGDKMLGKPHIFISSTTRLINLIKHEQSCKILYLYDIDFALKSHISLWKC